jgi:hypothetical protein
VNPVADDVIVKKTLPHSSCLFVGPSRGDLSPASFPARRDPAKLPTTPSVSSCFRSLSTSAETQRSGTLSQQELLLECLLHLEPLWVRRGQFCLVYGFTLGGFITDQAGRAGVSQLG